MAMGATLAPAAGAFHLDPNEAAELCRQLDEQGVLDQPGINVTRGECVNLISGPASENANNFVAALCGLDYVQQYTGTTNKGQCIKVLRA